MKPIKSLLLLLLVFSVHLSIAQPPEWLWARSGVGLEYDQSSTVTTDLSGNVIVAGYFSSDLITFGTVTLQNNTPGFSDLFIVAYDPVGNVLWARGGGGIMDDKANSVATDADGNVYLTGDFYSPTITFGTFMLNNAGNVGDIFIVKYDPAGNVLWATREGGSGLEIPYAIVVDNANNFIVAGRFSSNSITFGTTMLTQAGSMDVFVAKYDPAGNVLWAQGAGGGTNDEAYALAVDAAGDVIVAGYFTQVATFGSFTLPNSGQANIFLAQCDGATGTFQWAKATGSGGDERALAIALDALDNIYVAGFFQSDSLAFGSTTLYSTSIDNGFVARYDNDGDAIWAHGLNGRSKAHGIAVANNAVYACGVFLDDSLNYGPDVLQAEGSADLFLLKSDLAGNAQWAVKQTSGGESSDIATAMAADAAGNLVMAGYFNSDVITFGTAVLTNSNGFDMFVIRAGDPEVGIGDTDAADPIHLFPNPGSGHFMLQGLSGIRTVEVCNALGAVVHAVHLSAPQDAIELHMPALPAGLYHVLVIADGRRIAKKLMIQE